MRGTQQFGRKLTVRNGYYQMTVVHKDWLQWRSCTFFHWRGGVFYCIERKIEQRKSTHKQKSFHWILTSHQQPLLNLNSEGRLQAYTWVYLPSASWTTSSYVKFGPRRDLNTRNRTNNFIRHVTRQTPTLRFPHPWNKYHTNNNTISPSWNFKTWSKPI